MKTKLKKLGERIINDNYLMTGFADDPEWLEEHLWMFQEYNPGLFHEQLKEFLRQKLPDIDILSIIETFNDYNNNTQIKEIDSPDDFKIYSYSVAGEEGRYEIPIKLILNILPGNLCIKGGYSEKHNILFIQVKRMKNILHCGACG